MTTLQMFVSEEEKELIREEAKHDRRTMASLILAIVIPELKARRAARAPQDRQPPTANERIPSIRAESRSANGSGAEGQGRTVPEEVQGRAIDHPGEGRQG